ncbi:MAG: superoxide dismutase [Bacteroidales bacterium]
MKIIGRLLFVVIFTVGLMSCTQKNSDQIEGENDAITYTKDKAASDGSMTSSADDVPQSDYAFGPLPYAFDALEPVIDTKTMKLHYDKHHKGYYKKFLNAVSETEAEGKDIVDILSQVSMYSMGVRNNGGGYYNHWLFWNSLSPDDKTVPATMEKAINNDFGSMKEFKEAFSSEAATQFGSGWAWLIVKEDGSMTVSSTPNQDNPLMDVADINGIPILALDVWEHAYYVKYNNKRTQYIDSFWKIVDWEKVNDRYQDALSKEIYRP